MQTVEETAEQLTGVYRLLMIGLLRNWVSRTHSVTRPDGKYVRCTVRKIANEDDQCFLSDLRTGGWSLWLDPATLATKASILVPVDCHDVYHLQSLSITATRECTGPDCAQCVAKP